MFSSRPVSLLIPLTYQFDTLHVPILYSPRTCSTPFTSYLVPFTHLLGTLRTASVRILLTLVVHGAPGSDIKSAKWNHDDHHDTLSGTSMACPHVAGVVALHLSHNSSLSPAETKQRIVCSGVQDIITMSTVVSGTPNILLQAIRGEAACPPRVCPGTATSAGTCSGHGACGAETPYTCTCDCGFYGWTCSSTLGTIDIADICQARGIVGSTVNGATALGSESGSSFFPSKEAYYRFTLQEARSLSFSLCGSHTNFDTTLRLFRGCPSDIRNVVQWSSAGNRLVGGGNHEAYNDDGRASCAAAPSGIPSPSFLPGTVIAGGYFLPLDSGEYYVMIEGEFDAYLTPH